MAEDREQEVLERYAVVSSRGVILAILPSPAARATYTATRTVTLDESHVLIPSIGKNIYIISRVIASIQQCVK
jgi:alkyl hydroperoxide reductase subunit AhpC